MCLAQEQARVRAEMVRKFTQELESREDQVHEIKEGAACVFICMLRSATAA